MTYRYQQAFKGILITFIKQSYGISFFDIAVLNIAVIIDYDMVAFFEAASAIATVGLTLGVTPELSDASRAVLILLMYFGRVGSLTVLFAVSSGLRQDAFRYPAEEVAVG